MGKQQSECGAVATGAYIYGNNSLNYNHRTDHLVLPQRIWLTCHAYGGGVYMSYGGYYESLINGGAEHGYSKFRGIFTRRVSRYKKRLFCFSSLPVLLLTLFALLANGSPGYIAPWAQSATRMTGQYHRFLLNRSGKLTEVPEDT
jgi:hypothetical protein